MDEFIRLHAANQSNSIVQLRSCLVANCVVTLLSLFIASSGNAIILFSIWRTPSLHSPSNTLLFSLSMTDFLVGTITQPLYFVSRLYYLIMNKDGPQELHDAFDVTSSFLAGVSFITVTLISIDRYVALFLHLRYRYIVTNQRVLVFVFVSWILAAMWGFVWTQNRELFYILGFVSSFTCFSIIMAMYWQIYRVIRRHSKQIKHQPFPETKSSSRANTASYTRSVINTFLVCFLLFLCYFPYLCTAAIIQFGDHSTSKKISLEVSGTIIFINSSLNPFVYFWRVGEFRSAIKNTLKRFRFRKTK